MSLQDDCNTHHQSMFDKYNAWVEDQESGLAAAQANGATLNTLIAWETALEIAAAQMRTCCDKAKNAANSISGVTVQSSPGPKRVV